MKFLLLLCFALPLFATKLVDFNVYERNDRVDLMLVFDSAYKGKLVQKKEGNFVLITLDGLSTAKEEKRELKSNLLKQVLITPQNKQTLIMLETQNNASVNAGSDKDQISLRVRVLPEGVSQSSLNTSTASILNLKNENNQSIKPKNSSLEGFDFTNYILVLSVLVLLLIVLWWIKRKLEYKNNFNSKEVKLIFQRPLDKNNKFVILEYDNKRYTLIIGASNLLLQTSDVQSEESLEHTPKERSFDSFFEENKQKIQNLIKKKEKQ